MNEDGTPSPRTDAGLGTNVPTLQTLPVHCAPQKAPCPTCGQHGRRQRKLPPRKVRTVADTAIASLGITCGEDQARCDCCTTSRNTPEGVLPRALYDNTVRDLVLERIIEDGMNIEQTLKPLRREFLLELSTGFVYDLLRERVAQLDRAAHRRMVLEQFSGTLGVDEVHPGQFTLLLATDPIRDLPVAFALVRANDQEPMRRSLQNLKTWGLFLQTAITDGSNLDPAVRGELGPEADHQLGVSHILKEINELVLDAVRRLRTAMSRRGRAGRKKKPGRKGAPRRAAARHDLTLQEKSAFIFQHRHRIVKRREDLREAEREDLKPMLSDLPELATLRHFADRISWRFDAPKDDHQASCRRAALVRDPAFQAVPELVKAMEQQLSAEKFPKIMADLNNPVSQRVRTNNHVERTNRMVRSWEKVRYKWRRRKTRVRFVVLRLDDIWSHWVPLEARGTKSPGVLRRRNRQAPTGQESRQVA